MKGLKESYGSSLKTKAFAAGLMGLGAVSACDSVDADFSTQSAALTSFPGEVGETLNGNCVEYSIVPGEPEKDILCRQHPGLTTGIIVTVRNALAREGAVQIEPIQGTEQWVLPVIHNNRLYGGIKNQNGLYDLVSAEYNADGTISDTKMEFASAMGYAMSFQSIDGDLIINRGNNDVRKYKEGLTDGDPWLKVALNGIPAGLKLSSIQPYIGDPNKKTNIILVFQNEANGKSYAFEGKYDASTMTLEVVGSAFKTPNINELGVTNHVAVVNDGGCVNVVELYGGLVKTEFGGSLCDPKIPVPDATGDVISDADTASDADATPPDTSDLGPDLADGDSAGDTEADGDTTADGVDTDVDSNTDTAEPEPDLSQPDGTDADAETDNGTEGVTDTTTDGDDGEGPDVVEVSETDGTNGPDATPDVVVKNVCEQLGAVVNQPKVTLSDENGECVVTTEVADGEIRVDFTGDGAGYIMVKPETIGEVARFSNGSTPIQAGSVVSTLRATLTGAGSIEDGLNGGFMSSAVPGAKTTTTVIGGANVGDVPDGTTIKTVDGVTEVTAGPTGRVRVIATCLATGEFVDIQLEPGESNKKDPCEQVVKPPVKEPSSGGCNVAGEGEHKNGVGDLGWVLAMGVGAWVANRRNELAAVLGFAR